MGINKFRIIKNEYYDFYKVQQLKKFLFIKIWCDLDWGHGSLKLAEIALEEHKKRIKV